MKAKRVLAMEMLRGKDLHEVIRQQHGWYVCRRQGGHCGWSQVSRKKKKKMEDEVMEATGGLAVSTGLAFPLRAERGFVSLEGFAQRSNVLNQADLGLKESL